MTEHQPGSREWAEAEARTGAKLLHTTFNGSNPTRWPGAYLEGQYADGWSIYEPAPAQAPELSARLSAAEERLSALEEKVSHPLIAVNYPPFDPGRPTFTTSRKPEPGEAVMGDDQIVNNAAHYGLCLARKDSLPWDVAREAIRLTRASIRAQLAANEARAVKAGLDEFRSKPYGQIQDVIRTALKAHSEGV